MSKIDINFFKPFVDGTLKTLQVQCKAEVSHGKPFIKGKGPTIDAEIIAVVGLTSATFAGTLALYFKKSTFLNLMGNMLGEEFKEISPELQDGAAELLNMIFGHAKSVLNNQGYSLEKAIPSIIRGTNLEATHLTSAAVIVLPFTSNSGDFQIEISAAEKKS